MPISAAVTRFVHGTTLATNVILQRTGGPVALVTTEGFGDVLRLGRDARVEEDRYDLAYTPPAPPVDPDLTFEVRERVDAHGAVLEPLHDDAVTALVARVVEGRTRPASRCACCTRTRDRTTKLRSRLRCGRRCPTCR